MSSDKPKPSETEPPFIRHPGILPPLSEAQEAVIQARTAVGLSIPPDNVSLMDVPRRQLLQAVAQIRGVKVETDEDDEEPTEGELIVQEVVDEFERDRAQEKKGPARRKRRGKGMTLDDHMRENWRRKPENPGVAVARLADIGRAVQRRMINRNEAEVLAKPLIASFGQNPTKAMESAMKEYAAAMGKQAEAE